MTADEVLKAISAHAPGLLRLDKERLISLRLLCERSGLWGPGRRQLAPTLRRKPESVELDESHEPEGTSLILNLSRPLATRGLITLLQPGWKTRLVGTGVEWNRC